MEYTVDTYNLRVRLAIDGRTLGLIAKDAKMPVELIKNVLLSGKADKDTVEKIRRAVRPTMRFSTICPPSLQPDAKPMEIDPANESVPFDLTAEQKKNAELFEKVYALCKEYGVIDVFDAAHEIQTEVLCYMEESGFCLASLYDESLKRFDERSDQ